MIAVYMYIDTGCSENIAKLEDGVRIRKERDRDRACEYFRFYWGAPSHLKSCIRVLNGVTDTE